MIEDLQLVRISPIGMSYSPTSSKTYVSWLLPHKGDSLVMSFLNGREALKYALVVF